MGTKPKRIRDTDYVTATMRIRALERSLFDHDRAERFLDARTDEEAIKVLAECGYEEMAAFTTSELDRVLSAAREELYRMVSGMVRDMALVDVFRVRYDYHNVKVLVKSEATGEDAAGLLIPAGRIPLRELLDIFRGLSFTRLPPKLSGSVVEARELLARTGDPQRSDFHLDADCVREMTELAEETGSLFVRDYVRLYIDAANLRALVRAQRIGKGPDFLRHVLCPGGHVDVRRISALLLSGGDVTELFGGGALSAAAEAGNLARRGEGSLTFFEKKCDDALTAYIRGARYVPFGEQPVLSYLVARESEMIMIRTIAAGRMGGVPAEQIRERLRESYV